MRPINIENSDAENMDLMHLRCTRDLSTRRSSALAIVFKPFVIFPSQAVAIILQDFPLQVGDSQFNHIYIKYELLQLHYYWPNFEIYLFFFNKFVVCKISI